MLDERNGARQVFASTDAPVRSVIVDILDQVESRDAGSLLPREPRANAGRDDVAVDHERRGR